jgi:hypothetical protein
MAPRDVVSGTWGVLGVTVITTAGGGEMVAVAMVAVAMVAALLTAL